MMLEWLGERHEVPAIGEAGRRLHGAVVSAYSAGGLRPLRVWWDRGHGADNARCVPESEGWRLAVGSSHLPPKKSLGPAASTCRRAAVSPGIRANWLASGRHKPSAQVFRKV